MTGLESIEDEFLVLCSQDGDRQAIAELVRRWQPKLLRHARVLVGRDDAAWDVLQESWLAVVRGIHRLLDPTQFRVWAYQVVTNKSNDWIRRQVRRRNLNERVAVETHHNSSQDNPEQAAAAAESGESLRDAMQRLGPEHEAVLRLFYLEQMNVGEIATALLVPAGTVKSRLFHARQQLKEVWLAAEQRSLTKGTSP